MTLETVKCRLNHYTEGSSANLGGARYHFRVQELLVPTRPRLGEQFTLFRELPATEQVAAVTGARQRGQQRAQQQATASSVATEFTVGDALDALDSMPMPSKGALSSVD